MNLGLLSGSVLPLWAALEKTVVACRAQMTKAEEALKASNFVAQSRISSVCQRAFCRKFKTKMCPMRVLRSCSPLTFLGWVVVSIKQHTRGLTNNGQNWTTPDAPLFVVTFSLPQVNRVILDDSTKLVGVRLPITALPTLRHHLAEAVQARKAVVDGGGGGNVEAVSPIDPKILLQVKTPPKNILSFFGRVPAAPQSAPRPPAGSVATPSPVRGKRQAGAGFASGWPGSGSTSASSGVGGGGGGGSSGSRKKRKSGGSAGAKRGKEDGGSVGSSASKGVAALFGGRSGGGDGGGGSAERKGFVPEVISIDDD